MRKERRAPDRAVPPDARHPPHRGGGGQGVRAGQDRRLPPPQHRPGGGVRRRDRRARSPTTTSSRPTASTATPTPRACTRQGRSWPSSTARRPAASKGLGGSMHLFDAEHELPRRLRHRRRPHPARRRRRVRVEVPRRRPRHAVLLRRGRVPQGAFHEGVSLAGAVEAAGRLHLREQPVLDGHAALPHAGGRGRVASARSATAWRAIASTATTSCACASASPRRCARARNDSEPTLVEVDHLPLPRPLDVRPGQLPHQGGGRGVEEARRGAAGARAAARAVRRQRGRDRRARGRRSRPRWRRR